MRFPPAVYGAMVFLALNGCSSSKPDDQAISTIEPNNDESPTVLPDAVCGLQDLGFANLGAEELLDPASAEITFAQPSVWEQITGNPSSTLYGQGGYPESEDGQGFRLFTGGNEEISIAQQFVSVPANASSCEFTFSADIGGWDNHEDHATVELAFLDNGGNVISSEVIGPVTREDRNDMPILLPRVTTGLIPTSTVQARLSITHTRFAGGANDGYVDNINVTLN